jgi:putative transposase
MTAIHFLKAQNLQPSMSRRGNCRDNAVAESFFQLLKRERLRRKIYLTQNLAKQDVFDYIKIFCNLKRRHSLSAGMSPLEYAKQYFERLESVLDFRCDSD